jgi:hypothetical protein
MGEHVRMTRFSLVLTNSIAYIRLKGEELCYNQPIANEGFVILASDAKQSRFFER